MSISTTETKMPKCFIPRRDVCLQTPKGSICFYLCFIPRRDSAEQIPKEVQLFLLMSYFVLGNVYWTFNLLTVFCLFETLKMFYPPKGLCFAEYRRRSNCFYLCFNFVLGNVYWIFNLQTVFCLFETLKMFYCSPSA